MDITIKIDEKTNKEIVEQVEEIQKPTIPVQKTLKVPNFPNGNHFGKWAPNFNMNNKQRPGRAASRWR